MADPLGVIAHKLAAAMAFDLEVDVDLRTRPKRTVTGKVTYRRTFRLPPPPAVRRGERPPARSNLIVTVAGEEIEVNRITAVRRAGVPDSPPARRRRARSRPRRRR